MSTAGVGLTDDQADGQSIAPWSTHSWAAMERLGQRLLRTDPLLLWDVAALVAQDNEDVVGQLGFGVLPSRRRLERTLCQLAQTVRKTKHRRRSAPPADVARRAGKSCSRHSTMAKSFATRSRTRGVDRPREGPSPCSHRRREVVAWHRGTRGCTVGSSVLQATTLSAGPLLQGTICMKGKQVQSTLKLGECDRRIDAV